METLQLTHFSFEVDGEGVALVLIDVQGQKMNTLSRKIDEDLSRIIDRLEHDSGIVACVLGSKKKDNFVAGADIEEIQSVTSAEQATELARRLQQGFARLESVHRDLGKPVVAAIHGAALGGGLELALACSERVVSDSPKTQLGLPEVKLGLFPGAGGTQRLPRLIGIANALDMILTGKSVRAGKAVQLGLASESVPEPIVLEVARRRALAAARGQTKTQSGFERLRALAEEAPEAIKHLALEENPAGQHLLFKKAREELLKKTRGNYPAPEAALEAVRIGIQEGLAAGYNAEAERFGRIVMSPEARALIALFFATQAMKKDKGTRGPADARPVRKVGILGGGLMGGGIAAVTALDAGVPARIKDVDDAGVARGLQYVRKVLDADLKRRRRAPVEADQLMQRVTGARSIVGFGNCEVVIEAVFEDLDLKQRVLREIETACGAETIFASNTSSLPIARIAAASKHPETVIGMHYFSPVEKMPLLEVIVTPQTADWVTATCVELGKKQGKTVIVVNDGVGFYTSRVLAPYMNETGFLLADGADVRHIDQAMVDWGFPVGPVTLLDEVGIDVAVKVAKIMYEAFGARMQAAGSLDAVIKDDRKGRKNGRGFYLYEEGRKGDVDSSVYALLGQGGRRRPFAAQEIQERLSLQFMNEAALCLQEGVLRSARDGDIGAIMGLGFPPFRGGPFATIDRVGAADVVRRLEGLSERFGERFAPAQLLKTHAGTGNKFRTDLT